MPNPDKMKFWKDYVKKVGENNFKIFNNNGMSFIESPFWVGPDPSEALGGEGIIQPLMAKADSYYKSTDKKKLKINDLNHAFMSLHNQFFDRELLRFINEDRLDATNKEFWQFVTSIWIRQEFNGTGDKRDRWIKILSSRPKVPFLTADLPETFTAYRAGELAGLSWTLDLEVAKWFQARFSQSNGSPDIPFHTRECKVEDAIFYTNERSEMEVVIIP